MTLDFDQAAASRRVFEAVKRQQDLAEVLGLTRSAISYLKRSGKCTLDLVLAAVQVTGKPLAWFVYGKTDEADFQSEVRLVTEAALGSARKCSRLAEELRVAEPSPGYGPEALSARVELLERFYETFIAWMKVIEARFGSLQKENERGGG